MFYDLINLFYPKDCKICGRILVKNENTLCLACIHELPITNYSWDNENPVKKVFYGRAEIENATSLLIFNKKGVVQKLIHQLKYKGQKEIGLFLGQWMGKEINKSINHEKVDVVVPVPLHKKKLKTRGFNQVEDFGKEIAAELNIPYLDNVLLKTSLSSSQTLKGRLARWGEIEETFVLSKPESITGKHILLVDDLITTGATLEACVHVLQQAKNVRISIATMAIAG